ncbi:hypothetical protein COCNU_04G008740 [Cocos nucifera]|uniref:DUF4005 domain-containing protein n=1 Tax=Cocos nucifera TaxID=13894 RepID=A0A8K0N0C3_COCNU|nr:hypothetical protein COCNU_04G008740 [Cocos nucifera]
MRCQQILLNLQMIAVLFCWLRKHTVPGDIITTDQVFSCITSKRTLQEGNETRWDGSIFSKEEIDAIVKSRQEAALKRERAMEYASAHQERRSARRATTPSSKEADLDDLNDRWSWLEQWVGSQPLDEDIPEVHPSPSPEGKLDQQELRASDLLICLDSDNKDEVEETQLRYLARRSFNRSRRTSTRDDDSFSPSPSFPNYMASTASTKARFRSLSTPKQRVGMADICSDQYSPYTNRVLSPFPSIISDASPSKTSKPSVINLRSPHLKSQTGSIRVHRSSNYLNFDSECSLLNWDRGDAFSYRLQPRFAAMLIAVDNVYKVSENKSLKFELFNRVTGYLFLNLSVKRKFFIIGRSH